MFKFEYIVYAMPHLGGAWLQDHWMDTGAVYTTEELAWRKAMNHRRLWAKRRSEDEWRPSQYRVVKV